MAMQIPSARFGSRLSKCSTWTAFKSSTYLASTKGRIVKQVPKILIVLGTLHGLGIGAFVSSANAQDYARVRAENENSVVFIHSIRTRKDGKGIAENSYGTGFITSADGHVMTASHVVFNEDSDHIVETKGAIRSRHGQLYKLESVRRDEQSDVMVLMFPDVGINWKPVKFGDSRSIKKEAKLYTLGFPGTDLAPALGILSNKFGPKGVWQTTLPINRGNSGGPIFDTGGKVIAIALSGDELKQQITFAVPESYVAGLRYIASSIRTYDMVFAMAPVYGTAGNVSQKFQFYESVDAKTTIWKGESYCLPDGFEVTHVKGIATTKSGSGSKLLGFDKDVEKSNCVMVKASIGGDVTRESPVPEVGIHWFGMNVLVEGRKARDKPY